MTKNGQNLRHKYVKTAKPTHQCVKQNLPSLNNYIRFTSYKLTYKSIKEDLNEEIKMQCNMFFLLIFPNKIGQTRG